jgi:hypothetical protein
VIEADRMKGAGQGRYKGSKQICFLHHFVVEKLEKYKLELKRYDLTPHPEGSIFLAYNCNMNNKGKGDSLTDFRQPFYNACWMAWGEDSDKVFSPHDMRDFLQSALEKVEANPNLISPMLGHKVKGVDAHYSNHEIVSFLEVYMKALPLLIPQTVEQVKLETQTKLAKEQQRITELEHDKLSLKREVVETRKEMREEMDKMWDRLKRVTKELSEKHEEKQAELRQKLDDERNARIDAELESSEQQAQTAANLRKLPKIIEEDHNKAEEQK